MTIQELDIPQLLTKRQLKVTPQRIAILESLHRLDTHPTAEEIVTDVQMNHPHIATGTVYKTIETFLDKELITKVRTDNGRLRYETKLEHHHHIVNPDSGQITDYHDEELDRLLTEYFEAKEIKGLSIQKINIEIIGNFKNVQKL